MTGPVNRLLSRAIGQGEGGLRPRMPGLFEPLPGTEGAPDAISDGLVETTAPAPPHSNKTPPPHETQRPTAMKAEGPVDAPTSPPLTQSVSDRSETTIRPSRAPLQSVHVPTDPIRDTPQMTAAEPKNDPRPSAPSPPPDMAEGRGTTTDGDMPPKTPAAAGPPPPASVEHRAMPIPEPAISEPLAERPGLSRDAPTPARTAAQPAPPPAAEPDIHIHIGRLEVRTAAPAPANRAQRSRTPKRAAKGQSLSDYLKERG